MHIIRQKITHLLAFSLLASVCSFSNLALAEAEHGDAHHAQNSLDWPGLYYGFLPCDDCNGVKTTLALNQNGSYVLITQYIGRSEREFVEKGKFSWGDKSDTIVLTPRNKPAAQQYFVGENMLVQLDKNGNRVTGKLGDRYILRRNDVTKPTTQHAGH